jgi:hypothetical protein
MPFPFCRERGSSSKAGQQPQPQLSMQPRKSLEVVQGSTRSKAGHRTRGRKEDLLQVREKFNCMGMHIHCLTIGLPTALLHKYRCSVNGEGHFQSTAAAVEDNFADIMAYCIWSHSGGAAAANGHGQQASKLPVSGWWLMRCWQKHRMYLRL